MTRKKKVVAESEPVVEEQSAEMTPSSTMQTVGDLAFILEDIFCRLRNKLEQEGHPEAHEAAKEMLSNGYGLAMLSINVQTKMATPKPRLIGFNR